MIAWYGGLIVMHWCIAWYVEYRTRAAVNERETWMPYLWIPLGIAMLGGWRAAPWWCVEDGSGQRRTAASVVWSFLNIVLLAAGSGFMLAMLIPGTSR